jgi:hypothetical protein
LNVESINLNYTSRSTTDNNNVEHHDQGQFNFNDGQQGSVETLWFETDRRFSIANINRNQTIEISQEINTLPNITGFGNLFSLHQTIALDETGELQKLVESYVNAESDDERSQLLQEVIFSWAGQSEIEPDNRLRCLFRCKGSVKLICYEPKKPVTPFL